MRHPDEDVKGHDVGLPGVDRFQLRDKPVKVQCPFAFVVVIADEVV